MLDIKLFINKFIWTLSWNRSLFLTKKYSNSYLIEWMQNFILPISSSGSYVYHMYVCLCVYTHMDTYLCVYIYMCVCIYVYVCVFVYLCISHVTQW